VLDDETDFHGAECIGVFSARAVPARLLGPTHETLGWTPSPPSLLERQKVLAGAAEHTRSAHSEAVRDEIPTRVRGGTGYRASSPPRTR
jgi:hypothetical protein